MHKKIFIFLLLIFYLIAYRYFLHNLQLLPSNFWEQWKLFFSGLSIDLFFFFVVLIGVYKKKLRLLALSTLILLFILNLLNFSVTSHIKSGIHSFSLLVEYISEIIPLAQTGFQLIEFRHIIFLILIPSFIIFFLIYDSKKTYNLCQNTYKKIYIIFLIICTITHISLNLPWRYITFGHRFYNNNVEETSGSNVFYRMLKNDILNIYRAFEYKNIFAQNHILQHPWKSKLKKENYTFIDPKYPLVKSSNPPKKNTTSKKFNIVLIILESVAAKDTSLKKTLKLKGINNTPFLNSLLNTSFHIPYFFSNSDYTAGAEINIFCSYHDTLRYTMDHGSILRNFTQLGLKCLPTILKEHGYKTSFFHSYTTSFDNKNLFFSSNGVDTIIDRDHTAFKKSKKTFWGISDEELLLYGIDFLNKEQEPFFASFLTVNNHTPFILHNKKDFVDYKVSRNYNKYLNTVKQTDNALHSFFKKVQKSKWYNNTIFLITSDNGVTLRNMNQDIPLSNAERFKILHLVPFIIITPPSLQTFKNRNISNATHIDIAPTILDLLGIHSINHFLGESLFAKKRRDKVLLYDFPNNFYIIKNNLLYSKNTNIVFNIKTNKIHDILKNKFHPKIKFLDNYVKLNNTLIYTNKVFPSLPYLKSK